MSRILGLLLAVAVVAGACGDDDPEAQEPAPQATPTVSEPAPTVGPTTTAAPTSTQEPTDTTVAAPTPTRSPEQFWVEDLTVDEAGVLWATTGDRPGRLYRLVDDAWQLVKQPTTVFDDPINWEIRAASGGGVYVGSGVDGDPSPTSGVYFTDGTNWELLEQEFTCGSLAVDTNGQLWATCPDFLTRWVDGRWTDVPEGQSAQSVAAGPDGSIWFTTFSAPAYELWRLDGTQWAMVALCEDCGGPRSILGVDADGGAWVARGGCGREGLTRFDSSGGTNDFEIRGARDIAFGPDGAVWAALPCLDESLPSGLARYVDDEVRLYTTDDGLPSNNVEAVELGPDGTLYAGTELGVSRYAPDTDSWMPVGNL